MSQEEIVHQDDHEEELDDTVPEPETDEPADPAQDPYANLTEEELRARLRKAEAAIVKNKTKPKPTKTTNPAPASDDVPAWGKQLLEVNEKRDFQFQHNLSPEAVDAVFRANGGKMPTPEQMENDEVIKTIVRTFNAKSRVAANTPSGGGIPTYKGRTYAEVATDPNASKADKQAAFEAARKKR